MGRSRVAAGQGVGAEQHEAARVLAHQIDLGQSNRCGPFAPVEGRSEGRRRCAGGRWRGRSTAPRLRARAAVMPQTTPSGGAKITAVPAPALPDDDDGARDGTVRRNSVPDLRHHCQSGRMAQVPLPTRKCSGMRQHRQNCRPRAAQKRSKRPLHRQ